LQQRVRFRAMPRNFFDPTTQQQQIVLIEAETVHKAEELIASYESRKA